MTCVTGEEWGLAFEGRGGECVEGIGIESLRGYFGGGLSTK